MSVRKDEKRDRWIAVVECGERNGKRIRKQKSFAKKKDALQWEREMQNVADNADLLSYDITFCNLAKLWLDYAVKKGLAPTTIRKKESSINRVKDYPMFKKRARDVKMREIEEVLIDLGSRYSRSYVLDIKSAISSVYAYGIDQDYLVKNPCSRAAMPRETQPGRDNIDSFTKEEVSIIESYRDTIEFGDIIYIMLNTGLRTQEICAIDKSSIARKNGKPYLIVDKALKKGYNGVWAVGSTKTEASTREIPISEEVSNLILTRVIRSHHQTLLPAWEPHMSYPRFYQAYKKFFDTLNDMSDTKVRFLPPHCCRHTFTSRCEWSGVPAVVTKELLGHTSLVMTNHYTHIMDEEKEAAIARII